MRTIKYYWYKVDSWVDDKKWLKAICVVAVCILLEIIFLFVARACTPDRIPRYFPILFPLALIIHMFLSAKGFDPADGNDGWAGLCSLIDIPVIILYSYWKGNSRNPITREISPMPSWINIAIACIIGAACLWIIIRHIKHGLIITLLQVIRTLLNLFIIVPYLVVLLLGTDTRPDNEETQAANQEEIRRYIRANSGKDVWEKEEEKVPGFLDMLDDLAQGGEKTGENVAYGSHLYDVRQSASGEKFIVTGDGKKRYNEFTGKYEDD